MRRETPEWAKMTPDPDGGYELQIISGGDCLEIIELLRSEYVALKRIVAEWRGIAVTDDIEADELALSSRNRKQSSESPSIAKPPASAETMKIEFSETFKASFMRIIDSVVSAASAEDLLLLGCVFNEMASVPCGAYEAIASALGREVDRAALGSLSKPVRARRLR